MRREPAHPRLAQGSALVFILILLMAGAAFLVSALKSNPQVERDKVTADVLAEAKDALIGYAATYRDTSPGNVFGYLPCPDTDNDGVANTPCGAQNVSVIGRLPWKTLGLPPLRDSSGECLWYAVSGRYKNNPMTAILNWDTTGQFIIQDADGAALANGVVAVVFAARGPNAGQARTSGANECGGDNTNNINAYLDGNDTIYTTAPAVNADSTLTLSSLASIAAGTNNDRGLWIAANEVWDRVIKRKDFIGEGGFPGEINNLLNSAKDCLIAQTTLPDPVTIDFSTLAETPVASGSVRAGRLSRSYIGNDGAICLSPWQSTWNNIWWVNFLNYTGRNFYANWQDNLLYVKCGTGNCLTVNGDSCRGVLIFAGQNSDGTQRLVSEKNDPSKYLESQNYTSFISAGTAYSGTTTFDKSTPSVDIVACIPPAAGGGPWPFEYPTQWNGVPQLDASDVAVGGTADTTGTSGNDDVIISGNLGSWINLGSGNDELLVTGNFTGGGSFGAGDDTVKISGNATATIDLGSGDDYLDIGGNATAYVDSGAGNDKVFIGGNATASISFGSGNDELHIEGNASGYIDMGSGSDKIRIDQDMSAYIDLGNDNDYLVIFGNSVGMQAGSGNDTVLIGGNAAGWLDLGPGDDYLEILGNSAGLDAGSSDDIVKITGAATNTINLGSGNDYLRVGGPITWIDGGGGTDRIYLTAYNVTNCSSLLNSHISTDVEHVKVSDGMCRGSNFTFP